MLDASAFPELMKPKTSTLSPMEERRGLAASSAPASDPLCSLGGRGEERGGAWMDGWLVVASEECRGRKGKA